VAARIASYPAVRRAALWVGVGFAAAYTGGAEADELWWLTDHAGADGHRPHLAQGCAFAVAARTQAGPLPDHVAQAVPILTGGEPDEATAWTDVALTLLGEDPHTHEDYLAWQAHTRRLWARRHQV
jgi:enediyne biosynthesis protein E3